MITIIRRIAPKLCMMRVRIAGERNRVEMGVVLRILPLGPSVATKSGRLAGGAIETTIKRNHVVVVVTESHRTIAGTRLCRCEIPRRKNAATRGVGTVAGSPTIATHDAGPMNERLFRKNGRAAGMRNLGAVVVGVDESLSHSVCRVRRLKNVQLQ
jgi:hypothetical protein